MGIAAERRSPTGRRPVFGRLRSGSSRAAAGRTEGRSANSLLERHGDGLFRYCALMLGSAEEAAQCVRAVAEKAATTVPQSVRGPALRQRLFRVAHEECIARLERRDALDEAEAVQARTGTRSELAQLATDLAALSPEQRSALLLRELTGMHHAGLADALGLSVPDAKGLLEEARQALEKLSEGRAFVALAGRGHEALFDVLYDRYRDPLYRYCSGMLGKPEQSEEALQAAISGAARALASDGDVRVRNRLVEMAHAEAQRRLGTDEADGEVRWGGDARDGVRGDLRQLEADVDALPPQQRSALVLRELNGLTYSAIGEALGSDSSTVKRLIEEARQGLEAMCEARMRACADMRTRLSDNDRREPRGRADVEHLRSCTRCQEFGAALRWRPPQLAALAPPPGSLAIAASSAGAAAGVPALRPRPATRPSRTPSPRPSRGGRGGGGGGGAGAARGPIDFGSRGFRAALVALGVIVLGAVALVPSLVGSKHSSSGPPAVVGAGVFPERMYVPNGLDGTVDVVDPSTFKVLEQVPVGADPQHVVPSWDMKKLYVVNTGSSTITELDPRTGHAVHTFNVPSPDNLYWTIDGKTAVDVSENLSRVDFRDPNDFHLIKSVQIPGSGANHLDFSGDGSFLIVTTELDGKAFRIDTKRMAITGELTFPAGSRPVDVMLVPEAASMGTGSGDMHGSSMGGTGDMTMGYLGHSTEFFVADQGRNGVAVVEGAGQEPREVNFIDTGRGAHGFAMSHDGRTLYVTNRLAGSISVIDVAGLKVLHTWPIGGNPDMIQLAPDGKTLWTSNRFDNTVSVVNATNGQVERTIPVGAGPHGLCYFPQPAQFSTGHCMFR